VKLLDFGVARIEADARITAQNMIVGTPEYISPEQIRSSAAAPSSDLYALGCVLFEMLTGQLPFEGKTTVLLVKHLNDAAQPPSWIVPAIPPTVDNLVLKLLQKRPEDRYRDGYHLAEDLVKLLGELPHEGEFAPRPSSSLPRDKRTEVQSQYEEDAWERTSNLYRDLLAQAHPGGDGPEWLPIHIDKIAAMVKDVRALRGHLKAAVEKRTEQEEEARRPKVQIGHALDELAKDDSRINREIEALEEELKPAESSMHDAIHVATTSIATAPTDLNEGDEVSAEQSALLGELVQVASTLNAARQVVASLKSKMEAKQTERRDLRFQMKQLKEKLEAMHAVSTCDMEVAHEEVNRIDSQIVAKLAAIKPEAAAISEHFKQFPELREQLARRHSGRPRAINLN
jgi:predicted  nucleic acid-binding Zn-ribbon protein